MRMLISSWFINTLISLNLNTMNIPITMNIPSTLTIAQTQYDEYSNKYDIINSGLTTSLLGIDQIRNEAGKQVSGNVLEIAIGTALQSDYYDWNKITSFNGIDNSIGMLDKASDKIKGISQNKVPIQLTTMDATKLKFESNKFDTVIDTFSMCVFPEPSDVLKEMIRVVKDDGKIILLENSVSTNPILKTIQNIFEPIVTPFSKDCKWNVDIPQLAKEEGLQNIKYLDIQSGTIMLGIYNK